MVRDGSKDLVPFSSLKSTEKEATDINEFALATRPHSKDKKAKKSKGERQKAACFSCSWSEGYP